MINTAIGIPPKIRWLANMALYLSGITPDFVARRHGFRDAAQMHAAFLFAWELHRFFEQWRAS